MDYIWIKRLMYMANGMMDEDMANGMEDEDIATLPQSVEHQQMLSKAS